MREFLLKIASVIIWLVFFLSVFLFFPVSLVIWLISLIMDKKRRMLHWFTCLWSTFLIVVNPLWKVRLNTKKTPDTVLYISNHQSLLDILIVNRMFRQMKWVAKKELFSLPFVGWLMSMNHYIRIDRGNKASAMKMFEESEKNLARGIPVFIFPEGTRSENGQLRPFKDGAFVIAKKCRVPIQPVFIRGTFDAIPKKSIFIKNTSKIEVAFLETIPLETIEAMEVHELKMFVYSMYETMTEQKNK